MNVERLKTQIEQIRGRLGNVVGRGEEATKQALVLPMLDALGYDIWNPGEVCPEYDADLAMRKGAQKERVDMAVLLDGAPRIFFEIKPVGALLEGHQGQLARYFNATQTVSLAILTNGVEYRFFTDTAEPNVLDGRPFHVMSIDSSDLAVDVLLRFHRTAFSPTAIREYASDLIFTEQFTSFLRDQVDLRNREPSEEFVRWVLATSNAYDGRVTASTVDRFRPLIRGGLQRVLRDVVRRSVSAMDLSVSTAEPAPSQVEAAAEASQGAEIEPGQEGRQIVTTERELRAFAILKGLFDASPLHHQEVQDGRATVRAELGHKDTTSYFGVYVVKPFWWVARLGTEARFPWIQLNLDEAAIQGQVPVGFEVLSGGAVVRLGYRNVEALSDLGPLFLLAAQRLIEAKQAAGPSEDNAAAHPMRHGSIEGRSR